MALRRRIGLCGSPNDGIADKCLPEIHRIWKLYSNSSDLFFNVLILLAIMIKLMEVVWFEVEIILITVLCSDLNPAGLLPQPEPQPTSNEHWNNLCSEFSSVVLSWEA